MPRTCTADRQDAATYADPPAFAAFEHRGSLRGFEVAFFRTSHDGYVVDGHTAAIEDGEPYAIGYTIELDRRWRTRWARVRGRSSSGTRETEIESDGDGRWIVDGEPAFTLDGCLDLDLESSALTNAFPMRRLLLRVGEDSEAPAAWIRAADLRVERLDQHYERLEDARDGRVRFRYAAPRFDFRSQLQYDGSGLVVAYPGVAVRRA